jgi:hypothetical protein
LTLTTTFCLSLVFLAFYLDETVYQIYKEWTLY